MISLQNKYAYKTTIYLYDRPNTRKPHVQDF